MTALMSLFSQEREQNLIVGGENEPNGIAGVNAEKILRLAYMPS